MSAVLEYKELEKMDVAKLKETLLAQKKEAFNLRFQQASGELEKSHGIRQIRRNVARINTALRAKENKGDK